MTIEFDLAGYRAAKDKPAWYREQGWKHLETAVAMRKMDTALADQYRVHAEAMFRHADQMDPTHQTVRGDVVADPGEIEA